MIIYKITNKINGKVYIGQTRQKLSVRVSRHKYDALRKNKNCHAIQYAINKYGFENFAAELVDSALTQNELNQKEKQWIIKLNTLAPFGYNLRLGEDRKTISDTTRQKMSEAQKGRIPWNKGMPMKEETKLKLSIINSKQIGHWLNKKRPGVGEKCGIKLRKRYSFISPNGVMYITNNLKQFAQEHGLQRASLHKVYRGTRKSYRGWVKNPNLLDIDGGI